MNELSPYLLKLLLEHDCAIIPDFGGFMMQRHPAHRAIANGQLLPPSKTVGFNALLRAEDGLLAHEVSKSRRIPYAQAADFVQQCVRDMKRDLMRGIEVEFDGVGTLSPTTNGLFDFRPAEHTTFAPENYFLTPLTLSALPVTVPQKETDVIATSPAESPSSAPEAKAEVGVGVKHPTTAVDSPFFSRNAYRAFAAMFVIALCFFWSIPLNRNSHLPDNKINTEMFAQLPQMKVVGEVLSSIAGEETPVPTTRLGAEVLLDKQEADSLKKQAQASTATPEQAVESTATTKAKVTEEPAEKGFALVLASQTTREGADHLVNRLQKQGFKSARAQRHNGFSRVLVGYFLTRQAAKAALTAGRNQSLDFDEAWITEE